MCMGLSEANKTNLLDESMVIRFDNYDPDPVFQTVQSKWSIVLWVSRGVTPCTLLSDGIAQSSPLGF